MTTMTTMTRMTKTKRLGYTAACLLMLVAPCAAQAPSPDSAALARLDAFLSRVYPTEGRAGAVVLAQRHGVVIFRKAFGLADVELGVSMTPEHRLAIGSMTKPFTALAVLRMADEGLVALDDPVVGYVPEVAETAPDVTVAHLLSHTGGIRNYNEIPSFQARIREDFTPEELLAVFAQQPPDFPPGTAWHYSNSGYHLLGLTVERVTGRSFAEVLNDYVLAPIGARDAVLASDAAILRRRVPGYEIAGGELRNAQPMSLSIPWAGGGLFGTVDDLAALDRGLASGILGDADLQRRQIEPVTLADGRPVQSSLGWLVGRLSDRPMQYHGGGVHGFVGHMLRIPDEGLFVAVLSNLVDRRTAYPTRGVAEQAARILLGEVDSSATRHVVDLPRETLVRCTGTYAVAPGQLRVIQLSDDGLQFGAPGGRMTDILPESESVFFVPGARGYLELELDERGDVTALLIHTADGRVLRAPKEDGSEGDPRDLPVG
jgi:CubicO group peptidase (beta-lactamase class C family)